MGSIQQNNFYFSSTVGWQETLRTLFAPKIPNKNELPREYHFSKEKAITIAKVGLAVLAVALIVAALACTAFFFAPAAAIVALSAIAFYGIVGGAAVFGIPGLVFGALAIDKILSSRDKLDFDLDGGDDVTASTIIEDEASDSETTSSSYSEMEQ